MKNSCRWPAHLLVIVLLVAGCGSDGEEPGGGEGLGTADSTTTAPLVEQSTSQPTEAEPEEGSGQVEAPADQSSDASGFEVLVLPAGRNELPLLGGVTVELPVDASVVQANSCSLFELPDYSGPSPFPPTVTIAEVRFSGAAAHERLDGIGGWIELYGDQPTPMATGVSAEAFSLAFELYRVEGSFPDGPPPMVSFLNCSLVEGEVSEVAFLPSVFSETWVAESEGSLVLVAASAFTAEEQVEARSFLEDMVPALADTGS